MVSPFNYKVMLCVGVLGILGENVPLRLQTLFRLLNDNNMCYLRPRRFSFESLALQLDSWVFSF